MGKIRGTHALHKYKISKIDIVSIKYTRFKCINTISLFVTQNDIIFSFPGKNIYE